MLRFSKKTLLFLLASAVAASSSASVHASSAQDCEVDVTTGECINDSSVSLSESAKQMIDMLRPLAEGKKKSGEDEMSILSRVEQLLEDMMEADDDEEEEEEEEEDGYGEEYEEYDDDDEEEEEEEHDDNYYADRHIQTILDILSDEECMSGSLDVSSPTFRASDAVRVFSKCRILHLRNFFPTDFLKEYKRGVTSYIKGISTGRISEQGQTNYAGEPFYFAENAKYRYDLCFTEDLIDEEIMANKMLLSILRDENVLDHDVHMLDFGAILAEPGAPIQGWHRDGGNYLFPRSFHTSRVAGHDLPPFAVAVITPLLNVTGDHGPTEFCMGSSSLVGLDSEYPENVPVKDPKLKEKLAEYILASEEFCHPEAWRAPVLGFGDMLLFDYNMMHRGGANKSPDLRALIYNTYVRPWYKDPNFSRDEAGKALHAKKMDESPLAKFSRRMQAVAGYVRIAIPDEIKPEDPEERANIKFDDLEKVTKFRPSNYTKIYERFVSKRDVYEFAVTNVDVDVEGLTLCFERINECVPFPVGENMFVEAKLDDVIALRTSDGEEIKKLTVGPRQQQIVFSSLNTKY